MKKQGILEKFSNKVMPIASKIGNEKHLTSISQGMFLSLPFMVIGAFFLILANPPIDLKHVDLRTGNIFLQFLIGWKKWALLNYNTITVPYTLTFGLVGLISAFGIAYYLAKAYKMTAISDGLISLVVYLIVCVELKNNTINLDYLGSNGLFIAIILGLLTVEISRLFDNLNWKIKLPDSVPSMVSNFINSLLPLFINILVFYGFNLLSLVTTKLALPA